MSRTLIRKGLQIPSFSYPDVPPEGLFDHVAAIATTAEQAGFDSVWVMDHFYQLPLLGAPDEPMFECTTLLCALAARTERVRLGAMVGGVTYRNPALLAKQITCLDVISKGRAIWGIGAAWFEQEHDGYGFEFGTFTERFERLEEALQIVTSMFRNDTTTFDGAWYRTKDALNVPRPIQPGGPPVLVGGSGERKTLRMVAQYADACNIFGGPDEVRHLLGVLDEHCQRLGRDRNEICATRLGTLVLGPTMEAAEDKLSARLGGARLADLPDEMRTRLQTMMLIGDPDTVGAQVQDLLDAGIDGMVFNLADVHDLESVAFAGEVLGRVLG